MTLYGLDFDSLSRMQRDVLGQIYIKGTSKGCTCPYRVLNNLWKKGFICKEENIDGGVSYFMPMRTHILITEWYNKNETDSRIDDSSGNPGSVLFNGVRRRIRQDG